MRPSQGAGGGRPGRVEGGIAPKQWARSRTCPGGSDVSGSRGRGSRLESRLPQGWCGTGRTAVDARRDGRGSDQTRPRGSRRSGVVRPVGPVDPGPAGIGSRTCARRGGASRPCTPPVGSGCRRGRADLPPLTSRRPASPRFTRDRKYRIDPDLWLVPFDPADPAHTPRGIDADDPGVRKAFADAVQGFTTAGVRVDVPLDAVQHYAGIPIHGCRGRRAASTSSRCPVSPARSARSPMCARGPASSWPRN